MGGIARFVLRHRLLVLALWLVATFAGVATINSTVGKLTKTYTLPGRPGYVTDQKITALYEGAGAQAPTVPVLTLPTGTTMDTPGVAAQAARVFAAAQSVPGVLVADYASTGDRAFAGRPSCRPSGTGSRPTRRSWASAGWVRRCTTSIRRSTETSG